MLLRSSSTPILGSLLPSSSSSSTPHYSESPNHNPPPFEKAPCFFSSSSSPFLHGQEKPIIRKVRSDGNLHSLLSSTQKQNQVLDTIPSFSILKTKENQDEVDEDEEEEEYEEDGFQDLEGGTIGEFGILGRDQNLNLVENSMESGGGGGGGRALPLFLARGLGIDRIGSGLLTAAGYGSGGGGGGGCDVTTGSGGERSDVENYYRRMVDEDPSNALFLRNYAQFLYQSKGDAKRAEEYYSRAILASPGDGEILSQYAKLVWELHNDKEQASSYFDQSVQAAPTDSHVLAAYANFLWETEDDDDNGIGDEGQLQDYFGTPVHQGILTSAST